MAGRFSPELEEELDIFDEEAMFEDGLDFLSEIDRRAALEGKSRIAASITIDLQDKGPLYLYVQSARARAIQSIKALVGAPATDAATIAQHQAVVREYMNSLSFIHGGLREGEMVAQQISEEFGHVDGDSGDEQGEEPSWRRRG